MPDYIYLLANRLSPAQQNALQTIREAAAEAGMTVFLTGGAVRDLTSGSPVRDIDLSVQGNALSLKPKLKQAGAVIWGEHAPSQTLYARFPGSVRVEVGSTRREEFPKPGRPVYHRGSILEDLRRRDFTANAMALSLNEGSYGLLMDPLNGVADLEARLLRLVSNYGFLEDPIRLVRAARLQARMGWELEEKTKVRFDNAREEGVISQITAYQQGYEVEEIVHEEDGLKILKALEADGWMKVLFPAWTSAKVDAEALETLRDVLVQLQMQGVNPDPSAAQAQLLTGKLPAKDLANLQKLFVRQGFVKEWESQDQRASEVAKRLTSKEMATPSAAWKLLTSVDPEAVLWLGLSSKSAPVQQKFKDFFTVWPEARQRVPYALMQEMRITSELPGYQDLVKSIFFELIDGKLSTDEEMRQFLEPHSPPAPPPPVTIRRPRAKKSAGRSVEPRDIDDEEASPRNRGEDEDNEDLDDEADSGDERGELIARSEPRIVTPSPVPVPPAPVAPVEAPAVSAPAAAAPETKKSKPPVVKPAAPAPVKAAAVAPAVAPAPAKAIKAVVKAPVKAAAKTVPKPSARPAVKAAAPPAKAKPVVKKPAAKPAPAKKAARTATKSSAAKPVARPVAKSRPLPAKAKPKVKVAVKSKPAPKAPARSKSTPKPAKKAARAKKKR